MAWHGWRTTLRRWYPQLDEDAKREAVVAVELEGITVLELSSDGLTLAVCTTDEVLLYDTRALVVDQETVACSSKTIQQGSQIVQLKWGPAGSRHSHHFLVAHLEGGLYSGQVSEGSAQLGEVQLLSAEVRGSVDWSPDGTHVVCSEEGCIKVFSMQRADSQKYVTEVELFEGTVVDSVYWTRAGQLMATVQTSVSIAGTDGGGFRVQRLLVAGVDE